LQLKLYNVFDISNPWSFSVHFLKLRYLRILELLKRLLSSFTHLNNLRFRQS